MYILGISAFYHDSAAVLIRNEEIIVALEEERFTRVKHDNVFPLKAITACLKQAGITIADIDVLTYYEKPLLKFERILQTFVETYPFGLIPFLKAIPQWLSEKIKVEHEIRNKLGYKKKILYIPHHLSHAAAAYFSSSYTSSAIVTIDGVGEYQTTGIWHAKGNEIQLLKSLEFPHSLGLLYSTFTAFLGFRVNEDEYKVMGLAAYGKPRYIKHIEKMISVKDDGSFQLDMQYFSFRETFQMWNKEFEKILGKPRQIYDPLTQRHKDLAASIQLLTEKIYFKIVNHAYEITKERTMCISGGIGLNALANGKLFANTPFKNIHIFGPSGDSGGAMGAALYAHYSVLRAKTPRKPILSLSLGTSYTDTHIEAVLKEEGLQYKKFTSEKALLQETAKLLAQNHIIGWFQGNMEFGPRALGNRSILANPKLKSMKEKMNKIKKRELFRPFACSILEGKAQEYFEIFIKNQNFPFMNFCFLVKKDRRKELQAVVHKDNTCRIQTIHKHIHPHYYNLIKEFEKITGTPALINTSFNLNREPIIESPKQAIEYYNKTDMKFLVIENFLISKNNIY